MEKKTPKKPVVKKKAVAPKAIKTAAEALEIPTSIVKKTTRKEGHRTKESGDRPEQRKRLQTRFSTRRPR
jgi:hypothetical protein